MCVTQHNCYVKSVIKGVLLGALSYILYTASVTRSPEEPQETGEGQWGDWEEDEVS